MKYQLVIADPYQLFTVHVTGLGSTHTLSPADCKEPKKRRPELPFGLQKVHIPRKQEALQRDRRRPTAVFSLQSSSSSSSATSSSSSYGCSSSSEATDKDDDSQLFEAASTPDPAFLVEEGAVMGAMQEQHEVNEGRQRVASTFFGNVGLTEVNLAVSNRSVCGVCTQAIEKKTARFAYHWNRSRPSKWMHSSCLADWLNLNPDMKQQSTEFLTHSLHSATEDLRPCILEALQLLEYMAD